MPRARTPFASRKGRVAASARRRKTGSSRHPGLCHHGLFQIVSAGSSATGRDSRTPLNRQRNCICSDFQDGLTAGFGSAADIDAPGSVIGLRPAAAGIRLSFTSTQRLKISMIRCPHRRNTSSGDPDAHVNPASLVRAVLRENVALLAVVVNRARSAPRLVRASGATGDGIQR